MLGVWIAPNGNKQKIIKPLKTATVTWGDKMRIGHSTPVEAWAALHTKISAEPKLSLPSCTLTEKDCKIIIYPETKVALPRARIVSNMDTPFCDGPISSLGAGVLSLYHFYGNITYCMYC